MFNTSISSAYPTYKTSSLISLIKKINFSSILNTTQKTLNVVNQAIPIIYQVKPLFNNAKTVLRVVKAVREPNIKGNNIYIPSNTTNYNSINTSNKFNIIDTTYNQKNTNEPTFFI